MYDCGVNLSSNQYSDYIQTLKEHSVDAGIKGWIAISNSEKEWSKNLLHCNKYSDKNLIIKITIGIHPHNAKEANSKSWNNLHSLITDNADKIIAIGECGLDYNRMFTPKDIQIKVFKEQIELAHKYNLPLYLHERDAYDDFYNILQEYKIKYPTLRGIVHCFTGKVEHMNNYVKLGFYIGITGWLCDDRRNIDLKDAIKNLPLNRLILETDSPFLIPQVYSKTWNTRRNQPDSLIHVVNKIYELTNFEKDEIIKTSIANTKAMFGI